MIGHKSPNDMHVVIKSPVLLTRKKPDCDRTMTRKNQTFSHSLTFRKKKKNPKKTNETEPVRTSSVWFKPDLCTPCRYASIAIILKKNGPELHVLQPN